MSLNSTLTRSLFRIQSRFLPPCFKSSCSRYKFLFPRRRLFEPSNNARNEEWKRQNLRGDERSFSTIAAHDRAGYLDQVVRCCRSNVRTFSTESSRTYIDAGPRIFKHRDRHKSLSLRAFLRFDKVILAGSTSSLINETVSPLGYLMHTYAGPRERVWRPS